MNDCRCLFSNKLHRTRLIGQLQLIVFVALPLDLGGSCYNNCYSKIRKFMLAVANFSYLYRRNRHYYLRLTLNQKQVWISLKTESLDIAVHISSQIKSLLANKLVISRLAVNQSSKFLHTIKQKINAALISSTRSLDHYKE